MSFTYTKGILKISVAQICQNIGWHAVQTSPMEILIDIAHRYILELSKTVHRYSNQYGRTEPNLDDLALTFKDFNISLHEMEEYVNNVEPVPFVHKLGKFPAPHPSNLQHPKPGSKELSHRPDFIPDYMPPMHPEFDDEENVHSPNSIVDNATKKTLTEASSAGGESPLGSPKHGVKRTLEWSGEAPPSKKAKHYPEEEGRPMREVTSVFMTPSGFISPAYEGKVAEPSLPQIMDSPPSTPEPVVHSADILPSKKEMKSKDSKKEKSSKSKKDKESSKKDSKKNKSSKKEKENKENAEISSEKSGNPSFSAKKEVNSHKSSGKSEKSLKIGDSGKPKSKGDKVKQKESKDDFKKYKDSSKLYKFKSKVNKHSGMSSNSPSKAIKSPKISKSPKLSKSPKNPKPSKSEKPKSPSLPPPCPAPSPPPPPPPPIVNKEDSVEKNFPKVEVMEERPELKMEEILAEARYRDESPESRLIIDDSIEAQARQEMESRLADLDKCIDAVIQRATVQCEVEAKKTYREMDETINEVVRGPVVIKKQEPKDIYDFTDSSNGSRPDSPDMRNSPVTKMPVKKEKSSKTPEMTVKTPPSVSVVESPKKGKVKEKHKKKTVKEQKPKTSLLPKVVKETQGLFLMSPKPPKSSVPPVCVKQEEKVLPPLSPPIKREEVESDEDSTPCPSSLVTNIFGLRPPSTQRHLPSTPFSQLPPPPPFVPSPSPVMNFSPNPFQHMRLFPQHMQPNRFPTPPLFVDMSPRADMSASFQASNNNNNNNPQPLNLAKSDSNTQTKSTPEKQPSEPRSTSSQSTFSSEEVVDFRKKTDDVQHEKSKFKDHKKEKKEKEKIDKKEKLKKKSKEKKEKEKEKEKEKSKEKKEEIKEKEKERDKPKEKQSKIKVEKVVKVEKKSKSKSDKEKKKLKEKEEKGKDDSPVPKMTLKLSSGTGAAKIFIKSSAKSAPSPVPPAPPSPPPRECQDSPSPPPTPPPPPSAPPPRIPTPTPAPVKVATPPPVSAPPSPPPPSPPPPPKSPTPPSPSPVEELLPPAPAPPPPPPPPPPQPVISPASPTPAPAVAPAPPTPVAKATHSRSGRGRGRRAAAQQPVPPARTVITETIGTIVDESGNKIWICPTCTRPDDGSPMIGCDECDDWYHWVCVNIVVPPKEEESWFCERCITKRKTTPVKRRRKKHKRDK